MAVAAGGCQLTRRALHSAVLNANGSKAFLKKMIPVAISFIVHQRVGFDEKDFEIRTYEGIQYRTFKGTTKNPVLQEIKKWINGALDALEKNYLREIYLVFSNKNNPEVVQESYKFQFKYMGNDVISLETRNATKQDLKESTDYLMTAIDSLNIHKIFKADEVKIQMAITYYDDITPPSYNPPFYIQKENNHQSIIQLIAMQPHDYLHLGLLKTGYHELKCRGRGKAFSMIRSSSSDILEEQVEASNDFATANENEIYDTAMSEQHISEEQTQANELATIKEVTEPDCQITPLSHILPEDLELICRCNIRASFKHIDLVLCSKCETFQHCVCLGYLQGSDIPDKYVCKDCDGSEDLTPTNKRQQKKLSIFRLSIAFAFFVTGFPHAVMDMLNKEMRDFMIAKLKKDRIIKETDNEDYDIDIKRIQNKFLKPLFPVSYKNYQCKRKVVPDSIDFDEYMSQNDSMVLGGDTYRKKRKHI